MENLIIYFLFLPYTLGVTSTQHPHTTPVWKTVLNHATPVWKTVSNPTGRTTQSLRSCTDKIQNCADYISISCQGEFIQWASEHCSASCKFCNPILEQTTYFQQTTAQTRHPMQQTTTHTRSFEQTTFHTRHPIQQTGTHHTRHPVHETTSHTRHPIHETVTYTRHPIQQTTTPIIGCSALDVVFLLDASRTIGAEGFQEELNITKKVILPLYDILPVPRFGIALYADNYVEYPFKLGHRHNYPGLLSALHRLSPIGGVAQVDQAIAFVHKRAFSNINGGRPGAKKILVVMGNGHESHFGKFLNLSHDVDIDVYFIGVGPNVLPQSLNEVTAHPHQIARSACRLERILLNKLHTC